MFYGYTSARVVIREDIDSEQLVDFLTGNKNICKINHYFEQN